MKPELAPQSLDYWKMNSELSVVQAALLIIGLDPSQYEARIADGKATAEHPANFDAVFAALKGDILAGRLKASVISKDLSEVLVIGMIPEDKHIIERSETDWKATTVTVADLKAWLLSKNMKPEFFFFPASDFDPLNEDGKYYAPKLAAAIRAWAAIASNGILIKDSGNPKQAIETWLAEHGEPYGLVKAGKINSLGMDQISSVANWEPGGGRTRIPQNDPTAQKSKKKSY